jgi:hypothetical protein
MVFNWKYYSTVGTNTSGMILIKGTNKYMSCKRLMRLQRKLKERNEFNLSALFLPLVIKFM